MTGRWMRCPETVTVSVPTQVALAHEILIESSRSLGPKTATRLSNFSLGGAVKVTVVEAEETARYVESAAFVATTRQVPASVTRKEPFETVHSVAVPSVAVKVTAPVLDPPPVASERTLPASPDNVVIVRAA